MKKFEPDIDTVWKSIIEDNDRYFIVENPLYKTVYYYNNWYIPGVCYTCEHYTDEEFKEQFELVSE